MKTAALAALKLSSEPVPLSILVARTQVPERTLRRWLNAWIDEGIAAKLGRGRATRYRYINKSSDAAFIAHPGFLLGLDQDLRAILLSQLRDLWTYNSAAIEGNTLTLGDTHFLLEQGLTVAGKPLKDHQEIIGHAQAIDLLYACLDQPLNETIIFDLHKAVQTEHISDIYKPVGAWKVAVNGTYTVADDGSQVFIEYGLPVHVPELMRELISTVNEINPKHITTDNAHQHYAKIHMGIAHIHPFWDGNGRIARLLANLPLLKAGLPPVVIAQAERRAYIQTLANYQIAVGQLNPITGVWPDITQLHNFEDFCQSAYSTTKTLVEEAFLLQESTGQVG